MNIVIIGYGKMGKMIEQVAKERGHQVGLIIDLDNISDLTTENLKTQNVAIEFTTPETAVKNITACFDSNIPVVSGTTGWHSQFEPVKKRCLEENQSFVYASNFSPGVNMLFSMNKKLAEIMSNYPQFTVNMKEIHHTQKLDAPSGTAVTLAGDIIQKHHNYNNWHLSSDKPSNTNSIPIEAIREGQVTGTHEITYDSKFDSLTLSHAAKNRGGFALGALLAAEFIVKNTGFYSMQDVLGL